DTSRAGGPGGGAGCAGRLAGAGRGRGGRLADPGRAGVGGAAADLHRRLAELDHVARRQPSRTLDLVAVDEGAVRGPEVRDVQPALVGARNLRVAAGDLRV